MKRIPLHPFIMLKALSSMYLALATLISILRPHGFHYWVMRVSGILQHAGRYPTFLCTQMSWTEAGQPAKIFKNLCHRFPEAGQARGFSCCSSCNLVRADFAVPWYGLGIHPTRWLKAGLLEAGCSRTWQTFFVEDRQDGNIDLVKAEDLNVDRKTGGSKNWRRAWVKQSWNPQKQQADSKTGIQESENEINQWAKTRETTGSKQVWGTEMNMQRWGETLTWIHWD